MSFLWHWAASAQHWADYYAHILAGGQSRSRKPEVQGFCYVWVEIFNNNRTTQSTWRTVQGRPWCTWSAPRHWWVGSVSWRRLMGHWVQCLSCWHVMTTEARYSSKQLTSLTGQRTNINCLVSTDSTGENYCTTQIFLVLVAAAVVVVVVVVHSYSYSCSCSCKRWMKERSYTCYIASYTYQKHFTILEVAADWHELMIPQCIMQLTQQYDWWIEIMSTPSADMTCSCRSSCQASQVLTNLGHRRGCN